MGFVVVVVNPIRPYINKPYKPYINPIGTLNPFFDLTPQSLRPGDLMMTFQRRRSCLQPGQARHPKLRLLYKARALPSRLGQCRWLQHNHYWHSECGPLSPGSL